MGKSLNNVNRMCSYFGFMNPQIGQAIYLFGHRTDKQLKELIGKIRITLVVDQEIKKRNDTHSRTRYSEKGGRPTDLRWE